MKYYSGKLVKYEFVRKDLKRPWAKVAFQIDNYDALVHADVFGKDIFIMQAALLDEEEDKRELVEPQKIIGKNCVLGLFRLDWTKPIDETKNQMVIGAYYNAKNFKI